MVFTENLRQKMMLSTFGSLTSHTPPWIAHNTAKHASEAFASVTGLDIGDFLYYFDNTNKRTSLTARVL